jgi:FMN phosphatase YigB (HAD superfamily)
MTDTKWIWFDMDGTIADLYGVNGWLEDLINFDVRPYALAKSIYNEVDILETLINLKEKGYNIGIISWGSKANNKAFDMAVAEVKKQWLREKCFDLILDKIIVTAYGVCKADTCRKYGAGILVDDEEQNRNAWDLGETIDATKNIIEELRRVA